MTDLQKGLKIAVIGAGAAGLTAAYLLSKQHHVSLFEKNKYFGGHANTITVEDEVHGELAIDTGFIVHNDKNYPNFTKLMTELDVETQKSDMSFSYYSEKPFQLYGSDLPFGMFALKRNLVNPKFYRFLKDIFTFNRVATEDVEKGIALKLSLKQYLDQYNFSEALISDYVVPMGAAIWSASFDDILNFPARTFLNFWHNHGLLQIKGRPQWYTVTGGSKNYVKRIEESLKGNLFNNSSIKYVARTKSHVLIKMVDGYEQVFDKVVIATHADQALTLLSDPTEAEKALLGQWGYSTNKTYFHTDPIVMPPRLSAWTAWNYVKQGESNGTPVSLTYWMNRLQNLPSKTPYLVTLNTDQVIKDEHIIREIDYTHPIFSPEALKTQEKLPELNGVNQTYFCGSYFKNGFHEDAVMSAVNVAHALGVEW